MSVWLNRVLIEPTVYWEPPSRDGLGGYTWEYPVDIIGRWQRKVSSTGPMITYSPDGAQIVAGACVWTEYPVEIGGYLWEGKTSDVDSVFEPDPSFSLRDLSTEQIHEIASQIVSLAVVKSIACKGSTLIKAFVS